jgi:cell division protein FtsQ
MKRAAGRRRGLPPSAGVAIHADKRFRRPDVRPSRRRPLAGLAWRAGGILGIAALVAGAILWLVRTVLGSPLLAVSQIVVHGNHRVSTTQIESLLDGLRGQSILRVDFEKYRSRVMESRWIADASLWRQLPSTVEVRVTERVPMAIARQGDQLSLVDNTGHVIDAFGAAYRDLDLPIVDGLTGDEAKAQLTDAFLTDVQTDASVRAHVSQIDVSNGHDVVVLLDDEPTALHLGESEFVQRIRRYLIVAPALREQLPDLEYVDLRFGERVYARSHGQSASVPVSKKRAS